MVEEQENNLVFQKQRERHLSFCFIHLQKAMEIL